MLEVTWKQQRQGSTLNLKFSITSTRSGGQEWTNPINVHNLALVKLKFIEFITDGCTLESYISVKKTESAKESTIGINVFYPALNKLKQCLCTDYWMEDIELDRFLPDEEFDSNSIYSIFTSNGISFYVVKVNITVFTITSAPLPVYSKLYEDTKLTDFHLTAKDGKVAVHKAVLGVYSEMFLAMLNGDWKETATGCVSIDGVTVETLGNLKKYMYLRTLPDDCLQLQHLLRVAVCYLVDDLKADCIVELVKLVTPANFNAVTEFACQYNVPELIKAIVMNMTDSMLKGINEMNINKQADTKEHIIVGSKKCIYVKDKYFNY